MLKLLRLLLIMLTPVVGLMVGYQVQPASAPCWSHHSGNAIKPLGYVEDGSIMLVADAGRAGKPSLAGIDVETGQVQFQIELSPELLAASAIQIGEAALSDDGRYVILPAAHSSIKDKNQIVLFDWKAKEVAKRFWLNVKGFVTSVSLKGDTLLACMSSHMTFWKWNHPDSPVNYDLNSSNSHIEMNDTGTIAYCRSTHFYDRSNIASAFKLQLALFDINSQKPLPFIDGEYQGVVWSTDGQSFTAMFVDPGRTVTIKRTFIRDQNGFTVVPELDYQFPFPGCIVHKDKYAVIAVTRAMHDPLRIKLKSAFGETLRPVLEHMWPDTDVVYLYEKSTFKCVRKFSVPFGIMIRNNSFVLVNPEMNGWLIGNQQSLQFWDFDHFGNWYPFIGLSVGLVVSLLIFMRFRRKRTKTEYDRNPVFSNKMIP